MAEFYLVCGMPGSGKTTFAKEFCKRNGYHYFSPDEYYKKINGDEKNRANKFKVWHTMFDDLNTAMENGYNCVVDTAAVTDYQRVEFLNWFPEFNHHLIYIDADWYRIVWNNAARERFVPEEKLEKYWCECDFMGGEFEDERWQTCTCLVNEDNELKLKNIYVRVGAENE